MNRKWTISPSSIPAAQLHDVQLKLLITRNALWTTHSTGQGASALNIDNAKGLLPCSTRYFILIFLIFFLENKISLYLSFSSDQIIITIDILVFYFLKFFLKLYFFGFF